MEDFEMQNRWRIQTCLVMAAGTLLGYLVATGNFPLGRQANAAPQAGERKEAIIFTVRLPADATLTIDGDRTKETGQVRTFQTPPLPVGKHYVYTLKATFQGKEVTREIHVAHGVDNSFDLRAQFRPGAPSQRVSRYSDAAEQQAAAPG